MKGSSTYLPWWLYSTYPVDGDGDNWVSESDEDEDQHDDIDEESDETSQD